MKILPEHCKRRRRAKATGKGGGQLRLAAEAFADTIRRRYRTGRLVPPHLLLLYLAWPRSIPMERTTRILVERKVREFQGRCFPDLPRQGHEKEGRSLTGIPLDDCKGGLASNGAYFYHAVRSFLSVGFPCGLDAGRSLPQHGRQGLRQASLLAGVQHKEGLPPNSVGALATLAFILGRLGEKRSSLTASQHCRQEAFPGPAPQICPARPPLPIGGQAAVAGFAVSEMPLPPGRSLRSGEGWQLFPARLVQSLSRDRASMRVGHASQAAREGKAAGESPLAFFSPEPVAGDTLFRQMEVRSFQKRYETIFRKIFPDHLVSVRLPGPFPAEKMASFPHTPRVAHGERSPGGRAAIRQGELRHTQALPLSAYRKVRHALPPRVSAGESSRQPQGTGAPLFPVSLQYSRVPAESALPWQAGGERNSANAEPGGYAHRPTRRDMPIWLGYRMSGPDRSSASAHSPRIRYRQNAQKGASFGPGTTRTATRQILLRGGSAMSREPGKLATQAGSLPLPLQARAPLTLFRSTSPQLPSGNAIVSTRIIGTGAGTGQSAALAGFAAALPASHGTAKPMPESSRNLGAAISLCYRQPATIATTASLPPGTHFAVGDHRQFTAEPPRSSGPEGVEAPGGRQEAAALASAMEQHGKKTVREYLQNLPPQEVSAVAEKVYGLIEKRLMVEHDRRGWL